MPAVQRKLVPASLLAALGLAAAGAPPFLPWVKVNAALSILGGRNLELKGIDLAQGKALVGMGVIGVVAALLTAVSSGARRVGGLVVVIAASMAVGFGATDIVDVLRVPEVNLSIQGLPTSLPTGLPSGFPTALPTSFPSFPFPFPTSFPSLFPSGFP